jgi:hypothetical protein
LSFAGSPEDTAPPVVAAAQRQVQASAIAADGTHGRLMIGEVTGESSYALRALDPSTLSVTWSHTAPGYISRMAVSDDGSMLYALLPDQDAVWQVNLITRQAVRTIPLPLPGEGYGPLDLAIRPGHPETVVVSHGYYPAVSPFQRLMAFDAGILRSDWLGYNVDGAPVALEAPTNEIEFLDADHLIGLNNQTTACDRQIIDLTERGLALATRRQLVNTDCFGERLQVAGGHVYMSGGSELDAVSMRTIGAGGGTHDISNGFGLYHPGLQSFIRTNPYQDEGIDRNDPRLVIHIEQYHGTRRYLVRHAKTDVSSPPPAGNGNVNAKVLESVALGASILAMSVLETGSGAVTLISKSLTDISPLPAYEFTSRRVEGDGATGVAVRMPTRLIEYDAGGDRLVVALPPDIGPSGNSLAIVRPGDGIVERLIALPGRPHHLAVSKTGRRAYVATGFRLVEVDLASGQVVRSIAMNAQSIAVKEDDPQHVAVVELGDDSSVKLWTLENLEPVGNAYSDVDIRDLTWVSWLQSNGPAELIIFDENTTQPTTLRLSWSAAGLGAPEVVLPLLVPGDSLRPVVRNGRFATSEHVVAIASQAAVGDLPSLYSSFEVRLQDDSLALSCTNDANDAPHAVGLTWFAPGAAPSEATWVVRDRLRVIDSTLDVVGMSEIRVCTPTGTNRAAVAVRDDDTPAGYLYLLDVGGRN